MKNINMFPKMKKVRSIYRPIKIRDSNNIVKAGVNLAVGMAVLGLAIGAFKSTS